MIEFIEMLVSPEMAKHYLSQNIANRRPKTPRVLLYSKEMKEGRWKSNTGETIKIATSGRVLDGQQRLMAIIHSGCSIKFHVAFNLDESVFSVLDTGSSRNSTDTFKAAGIKHENSIPSIIAQYNALKCNNGQKTQVHGRSTNAELLEQYFEDPEKWQRIASNSKIWYSGFAKILQPSYFGGFYALFCELDSEIAFTFFQQLATGFNITNPSVNLLRNKLIQDKTSLRKMPPALKIAFIIKTWNYFVKGEEPKILKYNPIGEDYPKPILKLQN
jgi:hypothetical protein